jgi:hypothetical protein
MKARRKREINDWKDRKNGERKKQIDGSGCLIQRKATAVSSRHLEHAAQIARGPRIVAGERTKA